VKIEFLAQNFPKIGQNKNKVAIKRFGTRMALEIQYLGPIK
jgi:hypothetical protein